MLMFLVILLILFGATGTEDQKKVREEEAFWKGVILGKYFF